MGKYIVELKKNETLYKAATRESDGTAYVCSAIGTPYTAPDIEQVRKEAYQKGYETGYEDGYNEPGKGKIRVGDEVIRHYKSEFAEGDDAPSIFLSEEDGYFRCLAFNGRSIMIAEYPKNQYRKTGRHFHEIAEVLAKMKESDNG